MRIHSDAAARMWACGSFNSQTWFSPVDDELKEMYLCPSYIHIILNSQQFHLDKTGIACARFVKLKATVPNAVL